jgi:methionyl-tRNA formyltransferase
MSASRLQTVALLARESGLALLREGLLHRQDLELRAVFTHLHLPKSEGGGVRPEVAEFRSLCKAAGVPLVLTDAPAARDIGPDLPVMGELDLLISLSWRYLVDQAVLDRFRLGGINLHRGDLPLYAGAIPVQRAIEAGEAKVAITAHAMTAEIDGGRILGKAWLDIGRPPAGVTAEAHAETIKAALLPLYAPLAGQAIVAVKASQAIGA